MLAFGIIFASGFNLAGIQIETSNRYERFRIFLQSTNCQKSSSTFSIKILCIVPWIWNNCPCKEAEIRWRAQRSKISKNLIFLHLLCQPPFSFAQSPATESTQDEADLVATVDVSYIHTDIIHVKSSRLLYLLNTY